MATLIDKLEHIVGRALGVNEVLIEDHGDGPVLTSWNVSGVDRPTQSEIDAVSDSDAESTIGLRGLRVVRNKKLAETDWTQSRDVTLSNDADWKTYRQALRDITKTYKSLEDVKWPTAPSE